MAERPNSKRQQIEPSCSLGPVWRGLHGCRGSATGQAQCYPVARVWEKHPKIWAAPGAAEGQTFQTAIWSLPALSDAVLTQQRVATGDSPAP